MPWRFESSPALAWAPLTTQFLDLLESFDYRIWAAALLLLLTVAALAFFRSYHFGLRARVSWAQPRPKRRRFMGPALLASACLLAGALAFRLSRGDPMQTRIALVVSIAVVIGVFLYWAARQTGAYLQARAAAIESWAAEEETARRELRAEMDPTQLRRLACDILCQRLECRRVALFEPSEAGPFLCGFLAGSEPAPSFELRTFSPLITELRRGSSCRALLLADASSLRPLPWASDRAAGWAACVEQLRGAEAVFAVPLKCGRDLSGLFLISARPDRSGFSLHHLRFAEAVSTELAECLAAREAMAQEIRRRRAATIAEIAERHTAEVRRHLVPSAEPGGPSFDFAVSCWPEPFARGLFHHVVSAPGGTFFLFLAAFPENYTAIDLAVRQVRFQTLLRTPPLTPGQDLSDLVAAKNRALMAAHDFWTAFGLFCAHVDISGMKVRYVNAGYCAPIHLRRSESGAEHVRLITGGPPLCAVPEGRWEEGEVRLLAEDLLIFPSEGMAAISNPEGEVWGESRLIESLQPFDDLPCAERTELALRAVERFAGETGTQPARLLAVLRLAG